MKPLWPRFWNARRPRNSRARRPSLEAIERRELLSGLAHPAHASASAASASVMTAEAIARYRVFSGRVPGGHGRSFVVNGPLLLGLTDGRGQVIGAIYNADGSRDGVVGLAYSGYVSLQITTPGGKVFHAAGTGRLHRVPGGLFGYDSLDGGGNLATVKGPFVLGKWSTGKGR